MSEAAMKTAGAPELTIERDFAYPVEAVFKAWTDEKALAQWMGPGEVKCPGARMEARTGGTYVFPMLTPDGKNPTVRGRILEFKPNKCLRFSWAWDQEDGSPGRVMEVCVDFNARPEGTRVVLHQTGFIDAEARDHHAQGWNGCLEKLAGFLSA